MKLNCWEIKRCGREPGGTKAHEMGVCPAATEVRLDRIHGGENAGRACWVIAGTFCGGAVQGTFAKKYDTCSTCEVYKTVAREEEGKFELSPILMRLLRAG